MRIAILHPYRNVAETESAARIVMAAATLGHEAREFTRSEDITGYAPDFVLSLSHQDPKLLDIPTYGVLTAPIAYYESAGRFMRNVLTYDGVLTVSPEVREWVDDLYFSVGKKRFFEFYANTLPVLHDAPTAIAAASRAMYIGTNWDGKRHAELFLQLAKTDTVRIHGPEAAWMHVPRSAYAGTLPFDGVSTVDAYRRHGIGLCLARSEFNDNGLPTSRIFETTAAGALAICPRNKFIQDLYGETVLYVDQEVDSNTLAAQIRTHVDWARGNGSEAMALAARAQRIFNERLSLQSLIPRVLAMHERVLNEKQYRRRPRADSTVPVVSYVMRAGGRPLSMVKRALASLEAQTANVQIRVVLVLYKDCPDIASFIAGYDGPLSITFERLIGGNRSATLWHGLNLIKRQGESDFFAILDDDDELFTNHLALLLDRLATVNTTLSGQNMRLVYGGNVEQHRSPVTERIIDTFNLVRSETLRVGRFAPFNLEKLFRLQFYIPPVSFIGSTSLLDAEVLENPDFNLSEDYYLFILLAQRTAFAFCPEITTRYHFHGENSGYDGSNPLCDHYLRRLNLRTYRRSAPGTSEVAFLNVVRLPDLDEPILPRRRTTLRQIFAHFRRETWRRKFQLLGILFRVVLSGGPGGLINRLRGYQDYQSRLLAGRTADPEDVRTSKMALWHWNPEPAGTGPINQQRAEESGITTTRLAEIETRI